MSKTYEASVVVNAPADVVYEYVADLPRHVEWNKQPEKMVAHTEGVVRVGSKYQTHEGMPRDMPLGKKLMFTFMMPLAKFMHGMQDYTVAEIVALEPSERVAWKAHIPSTKKGDLMRMNWEIRLNPQGDATEVVQSCEVAPPPESPFASMANDSSLAEMGQAETLANLQQMKSIVEKQHASKAVA